jgi:2-haloacid dehalogenase
MKNYIFDLGNVMVHFWPREMTAAYVEDLVALFELFDGLVFSCPLKFGKRDPTIFRYTLDKFGILTEESVFIEDNAKNVESAQSLGIMAILFQGDPAALRQQLGF